MSSKTSAQRLVLVPFAEQALVVEDAIAAHAHARGDVVALELSHQRVQHDPGEGPAGGQALRARHQGVLVSPVQRVAGLEGEGPLPLVLADEGPRQARRHHVLAVLGIHGLRQRAQPPTHELRARVVLDHLPARMVEAIRAVDVLDVLLLVPLEDLELVDDPDQAAVLVADRRRASRRELRRLGVLEWQGEVDRPGVALAAGEDHRFVEHAVPRLGIHGPLERRQRSVGEAIDGREVGPGDPDRGKRFGLREESAALSEGDDAIDGLGEAAMDGYEIGLHVCLH
jgi:hypothetical protein